MNITKITRVKKDNTVPVYDLTVENTQSFFANDILVHNCAEIALPNIPMKTTEIVTVIVEKNDFPAFIQDVIDRDLKIIRDISKAEDDHYTYEVEKDEALIALCTLSAINWGKVREPKDFEKYCTLAVRGLDALLDYQDYAVKAAERHTKLFRPLGVGIIGFAHWMAKNSFKYSDDLSLQTVDEYMEAMSFYLIKASNDLAKEFGACEGNSITKYSKGILPIDTRKKEVDELVAYNERLPWEKLREDLKKYGIRNSTVIAIMPAETSATVANETNGIEPVRSLISIKQSKEGVLKQVVPEYRRLKNKYELLWDQKSPEGYLKITAVLQKYTDQTISSNVSYNPSFYADKQIPMSEMLKHLLMSYKYGIKTWYYMNTYDGQEEKNVDKMMTEHHADAQQQIDDEADGEDCSSCKI